jgi:hypothetical protein
MLPNPEFPMTHSRKLLIFCLLFPQFITAQPDRKIVLSGMIRDKGSGEHLSGATVWFPEQNRGTTSNAFGYYAFSLFPGTYPAEISFVGYRKVVASVQITADSVMNWSLEPGVEVEEVSVSATRLNTTMVNGVLSGVNYLNTAKIGQAPAILGETDVLKTIQYLPGVKAGNEGTSGINVRGGSHDQNLFLLDGVPVYNTNHLFGYISTFNTDAIRDIRFYKGSVPARFGGRLSSVVDIAMKEGNMKEAGGQFSISPVSGKILLEGPLKKDVAALMVSGRRSWLDVPLRLKQWISAESEQTGYSFYDFNAKANWIINPRHRLFLSHYQGRDGYFVHTRDTAQTDRYGFHWGNHTSVLRWNAVIRPGFFYNTSVYYSMYRFREEFEISGKSKSGQFSGSGLSEFSVKGDADLSISAQSLKIGYQWSHQTFDPELTGFSGDSTTLPSSAIPSSRAVSLSVYAEDEFRLLPQLMLNAGFRLLVYYVPGRTRVYPEPRISAGYHAGEHLDIKFSVQKITQTIHLLTNNALNMPTDLWITAGEKVLPSGVWLLDAGIRHQIMEGITLETDVYYKPMKDLREYRPGVVLMAGSGLTWEELTVSGKGLNYGAEWMVEFNSGRLTGWAGYSLSWARRKFAGINNGRYFPYKFDRRNYLSLLANYLIRENSTRKSQLSCTFVYASGNAITIPDEQISSMLLPGMTPDHPFADRFSRFLSFPHPNNYRMPAFHHLDLSWSLIRKLKRNGESTWCFSVYNIYNRLNPYFYYKSREKFFQISMLPVIPAVSLSLKF